MADFGPVGGPGGAPFDDLTDLGLDASTIRIVGLIIRSDKDKFVNAITPIYIDGAGQLALPKHGGDGGSEARLGLRSGEFITEISGRSGEFVDSLTIETNLGTRIGFGGPGGGPVEGYELPPDTESLQEVVAFFGASGTLIDRIGVHTRPHQGS
jgi:Jacalin-like lectin domain